MKHSKKFNPFNLDETEFENFNGNGTDPDETLQVKKSRIKFSRLGRNTKTRPLWWLILSFLILAFMFVYLKDNL